jgi:hypothetical protein
METAEQIRKIGIDRFERRRSRLTCLVLVFCIAITQGLLAQEDKSVVADADGSLKLTAGNGEGIGPDIQYMPEWKAFGWFTAEDRVEWTVEVPKTGKYDVYLEWSVSDEEAGKYFVFEAGDQKLTKKVGKSGSWETFKTKKVGSIQLNQGKQKMVFKPRDNFKGEALLDLRELVLVPKGT